jgi:hypothetical protein
MECQALGWLLSLIVKGFVDAGLGVPPIGVSYFRFENSLKAGKILAPGNQKLLQV